LSHRRARAFADFRKSREIKALILQLADKTLSRP